VNFLFLLLLIILLAGQYFHGGRKLRELAVPWGHGRLWGGHGGHGRGKVTAGQGHGNIAATRGLSSVFDYHSHGSLRTYLRENHGGHIHDMARARHDGIQV
jgi:hypothetical protein